MSWEIQYADDGFFTTSISGTRVTFSDDLSKAILEWIGEHKIEINELLDRDITAISERDFDNFLRGYGYQF